MPLLRHEPGNENKSARGAYVFQEAEGGGGGIVDANIALPAKLDRRFHGDARSCRAKLIVHVGLYWD